jgi:hypothetical protein
LSTLRLAPVVLALAALFTPSLARACSCASATRWPVPADCQTARRVFAGTIAGYDWSPAYRVDGTSELRLAVDTVWRGEVPARIVVETDTLGGGGSCTLHPTPGQRFLVCDDGEGGEEPAINWCYHPAFADYADELSAALGPGAGPTAPTPFRWPWWTKPERLADEWLALALLAAPFVAAVVSAGVGAFVCLMRPAPPRRMSGRTLLKVLVPLACLVILARLGLAHAIPNEYHRLEYVVLGPPALALLLGVVLGYREVRRGGRALRGLFVAFAAIAATLAAGFVRLHLPVQPADAVACSEARAREHLRAYPDRKAFDDRESFKEAVAAWARGAPAACTDWGLSRMRADPESDALIFADGRGGVYWVRHGYPLSYGWEVP